MSQVAMKERARAMVEAFTDRPVIGLEVVANPDPRDVSYQRDRAPPGPAHPLAGAGQDVLAARVQFLGGDRVDFLIYSGDDPFLTVEDGIRFRVWPPGSAA